MAAWVPQLVSPPSLGWTQAPHRVVQGTSISSGAHVQARDWQLQLQQRHVRSSGQRLASQWQQVLPVCGLLAGASLVVSQRGSAFKASRQSRQKATLVRAAEEGSVGFVLLSAGKGKRMGASIPKQYLKLAGLEIALHSFETALNSGLYKEISVVLDEEYEGLFQEHLDKLKESLPSVPTLKFARGGKERQDSVLNGLGNISCEYVAVHDAARPLVTSSEMQAVIADAKEHGAALLGVPTKATIKQAKVGDKPIVETTPDRKTLFEAHTPQVFRSELLRQGFDNAKEKNLEVTDDASLVEALGEDVILTVGEYTNLKVTTPEDLVVAEAILQERAKE